MTVVNNRETVEGEKVFYVDQDGAIYDATVKSIAERDGLHYANLDTMIDGYPVEVVDVPHNTSTERHSWNHPMSEEERVTHYKPDFYGELPREMPRHEYGEEPEDVEESNP